jgi:surface polysaccharide O-acyltransferase-like enzyme
MRKILLGVMLALAISGCAKATPAAPSTRRSVDIHDGGNFFDYYQYVITGKYPDSACQPKDLHDLLIAPCDGQP